MSIWVMLALVAVAGALGGLVNAMTSDNGFVRPRLETASGLSILRPGFVGNVIVGAVAAALSWALYGPAANALVVAPAGQAAEVTVGLALSALGGATVVGMGGARWLSAEVDKRLLRAAAGEAAGAKGDTDMAVKIVSASPAAALQLAREMPHD